jgi:hypothetical protein
MKIQGTKLFGNKRVRRSVQPKSDKGEKVYYIVNDDPSHHKYRSLAALFNYIFFLDRKWSKKTKIEKYINGERKGLVHLVYNSSSNSIQEG